MAQDFILIINCGGGDAHQLARSVRGAGVYCEIADANRGFESFAGRNPAGLIAVAGTEPTLTLPPVLLEAGTPVLAIGGAAGALLKAAGGVVGEVAVRNKVLDIRLSKHSALFSHLEGGMRHVEEARHIDPPPGFSPIATDGDIALGYADPERNLYALQFQMERNDVDGYRMLSNFVKLICGCEGGWSVKAYLETAVEGLRNRVGEGVAICPMTGGVDSAACAALAHKALGEKARCVLVDTGLMTRGEGEGIERAFVEQLEVPILRIQASKRFLSRLRGVVDPEEKRRVVAEEFSAVLSEQGEEFQGRDIFLVRGTIYNDVLDGFFSASTAGVPAHWTALEPLRGLFKYEVRELGAMLGIPERIVSRQPFPSAGLAVRCLGEVTPERLAILREADALVKEAIEDAGADKGLLQYFAVLVALRALNADGTREGEAVILRAVQQRETGRMHAPRLAFELLDQVTETILKGVPGVSRVLYDLTPRPPAAAEME